MHVSPKKPFHNKMRDALENLLRELGIYTGLVDDRYDVVAEKPGMLCCGNTYTYKL